MKTKVPMCPVLPRAWTPAIDEVARAHAIAEFPKEAAGIVTSNQWQPLDNVSTTPDDDVLLSDEDLLRVANADLFFHSHPNGLGSPSAHDMIYQQQLGIPFVILSLPDPDLFAFGDQLSPQPLLGRGFRHGVHDCYGLMRDWYRLRGIDVPDKPRDWSWWSKGENLYLDGFEATGFERIDPSLATQEGDVLLFNFNHAVPMHGALVIGNGLLLHHASGAKAVDPTRLSATVPRARYQHLATYALRHVHVA